MTAADRENIMERLGRLSRTDFEAAIWRTLGGLDYQAEARPHARIGEVFTILDSNVTKFEHARAEAAPAAGCAAPAPVPSL
ncbi:MAG: hypothetical protein V4773_27695 [Verrucomicrobiota bacterium]